MSTLWNGKTCRQVGKRRRVAAVKNHVLQGDLGKRRFFCPAGAPIWQNDGRFGVSVRRFGEKTVVAANRPADLAKRRFLRQIRAPIWRKNCRFGKSARGEGKKTVFSGDRRTDRVKRPSARAAGAAGANFRPKGTRWPMGQGWKGLMAGGG
jgi:hypothetical protein